MVSVRLTLAAVIPLALGSAGLGQGVGNPLEAPAASAENPPAAPVFSIPDQLLANTLLWLDGSSSLRASNEQFRQRLMDRYPRLAVRITTSDSNVALEKLRRGEVDVVAMGRRLTRAEQDQGLVEVPISREKIAVIVGPDNPLEGGITLEQLAQIAAGQIDNWGALGGPDLPLRFVDRPETSDTRRALGSYPPFADGGLSPGPTVFPVAEDSTEAVIAALGRDGLGYAVVSQVEGRADVRMLTVGEVLPTDPRYPYSQPRVYVYNIHNPSPAALAFLGVVNTPANLVPQPRRELSTVEDSRPPSAETSTEAAPGVRDRSSGFPPARPWDRRGSAWAWLLAIPVLGGLLWWLLREPDQRPFPPLETPQDGPGQIRLTPRHGGLANAYWDVPDEQRAPQREQGGIALMVRLLDVTDRDEHCQPPVCLEAFPVTEDQQDLPLSLPGDDRDYRVELGYLTKENHWLPLVQSAIVRHPAPPVEAGLSSQRPGATEGL